MDKNTPMIVIGTVVLALLVGGIVVFGGSGGKVDTGPSKLDSFTQCLVDSGAKFYGAFWCPHCQAQKALFGNSVKLLPYIECSTPDGKGQLLVCKDAEVKSYPTWEFADDTRLTGEIPLQQLAEKTGCVLPADESSESVTVTPISEGEASAASE